MPKSELLDIVIYRFFAFALLALFGEFAGADSLEQMTNKELSSRLIDAVKSNQKQEIKALLNAKADPNAKDKMGSPVLVLAITDSSPDIVRNLINSGAKVNCEDASGFSPLMRASERGVLEDVDILIEAGSYVNAHYKTMTALILAAERNYKEIVLRLIQAGADLDWNGGLLLGSTALISAARGGHIDTVRILVDAGANLTFRDTGGWTALMWAEHQDDQNIIQLLKEAGAKK